jgi:hypothetical protein
MKRFAILLTIMAFAYLGYGQNCSKNRSSSNCSSSKSTVVVTHHTKDSKKEKKRRFDRMVFIGGAGLHYLPKQSTFSISGKAGGTNTIRQQRNWQSDAFLGIRYGMHGTRRANAFGVYGNLGGISSAALNRVFGAQGVNSEVDFFSQNQFQALEAGFLFKNFFRLSAGYGHQQFTNNAGEIGRVDYYTATTGFYVPLGRRFTWTTTATAMVGKDFQKVTIRPSTGIAYRIKFLRM